MTLMNAWLDAAACACAPPCGAVGGKGEKSIAASGEYAAQRCRWLDAILANAPGGIYGPRCPNMHKICSGTAQSKNGWGGSEGARERREPISNSLGSMCAAGWIVRKEGRRQIRREGNRCDHLHQWRIRISRQEEEEEEEELSSLGFSAVLPPHSLPCRVSSLKPW